MINYEQQVAHELARWQKKMLRNPGLLGRLSKRVQQKLNSYIPQKLQKVITATIKQMVRGVLFGATYTTPKNFNYSTIEVAEAAIQQKINGYKKAAAAEGGITGAGGILLGLADFPILLSIKLKLLFDIASMYGFNIKDYKERLYILHIFQLAFSGKEHSRQIFLHMKNWDEKAKDIPDDINQFDWQTFQMEYRDYIDIAKMAQLVPVIGAVVGLVVNYRLINHLGKTAMNAYRMRLAERKTIPVNAVSNN